MKAKLFLLFILLDSVVAIAADNPPISTFDRAFIRRARQQVPGKAIWQRGSGPLGKCTNGKWEEGAPFVGLNSCEITIPFKGILARDLFFFWRKKNGTPMLTEVHAKEEVKMLEMAREKKTGMLWGAFELESIK